MKTSGTLFSGFGGTDFGFRAAGLTPVVAVEKCPKLAEVYIANHGDHMTVDDVCNVNFKRLERPDILGISTVCKNASIANSEGVETEVDRECARAAMRAVEIWLPDAVIVENVWGYRSFDSFGIIRAELKRLGYREDFWHLNAADYGVPQSRKRLILIARRDGGPVIRPEATHAAHPKPLTETLFGWSMPLMKWNGWYQAIEDILHTLPDSEFAPWQLEKMGDLIPTETFLQMTGCSSSHKESRGTGIKTIETPAGTVATNSARMARALLVGDQQRQMADGDHPAFVVTAKENSRSPAPVRALIASGMTNTNGTAITLRADDEHRFVVSAQAGHRQTIRALLVSGGKNKGGTKITTRSGQEPSMTVTAGAGHQNITRGWVGPCKVVAMTPLALARFQSFPDWFKMPEKRGVSCTGIGNALPPLLAQRIVESILGGTP